MKVVSRIVSTEPSLAGLVKPATGARWNVARDADASAEQLLGADGGVVERRPGPQMPVARLRPDPHHVPLPNEARRPRLRLGALRRAPLALIRLHWMPRYFHFDEPGYEKPVYEILPLKSECGQLPTH